MKTIENDTDGVDDLFIDREVELAELHELADRRGRPTIALVYGRRRVGKTYLLDHAWPDRRVFYFVAADATTDLNRSELIRELTRWSGRPLDSVEYPTWRTVFRLLGDFAAEQPLIVVLDEFQYLMGEHDDIASQLVAIFDRELRGRSLLLVLSGSSISMMEKLLHGSQPLFGRSGWKAKIGPFDYRDAARMVPDRPVREQALVYGIFGGTPRYLAAIKPGEAFADVVMRTMLSPRGEVYLQLEHVIEQEKGIRKDAAYNSILAALASGEIEVGKIVSRTGVEPDFVRTALKTLEELGYVWRERNFDASRTTPYQYRIADNALAFWFRFVHANRSRLGTGAIREVWNHHVLPYLDAYMGKVFERMCHEAFTRYHESWGLAGAHGWARWEGQDRNRRPIEIDVVARLDDGRMLTGELKWSSKPWGPSLYTDLLRDLEDLSRSGQGWAKDALAADRSTGHIFVSAGGFAPEMTDLIASRADVIGWTLDDLYGS